MRTVQLFAITITLLLATGCYSTHDGVASYDIKSCPKDFKLPARFESNGIEFNLTTEKTKTWNLQHYTTYKYKPPKGTIAEKAAGSDKLSEWHVEVDCKLQKVYLPAYIRKDCTESKELDRIGCKKNQEIFQNEFITYLKSFLKASSLSVSSPKPEFFIIEDSEETKRFLSGESANQEPSKIQTDFFNL